MIVWENTAVASCDELSEVTAMPTLTAGLTVRVWAEPACIPVAPSGEMQAVKTLPPRLSRAHYGVARP